MACKRHAELQRAGGKRLPAADFLRGFDVQARAGVRLMFLPARDPPRIPSSASAHAAWSRQAPGIGAWGLMTGVAMVKSGMSVIEAVAMTLLVYRRQFAAGGDPADRRRRAGLGDPGHRLLRQPALHGVQPAPAALPHAPAALAPDDAWLPDRRHELRAVHRPLSAAGHDADGARARGLPGRQLLRHLVAWMGIEPGRHRAGQPDPHRWGLGFAGVLCLVGILCSLATTRLRMVAAASPGRRRWRPMRCR